MQEKLRIIFYGTPEFAVRSLDQIRRAGFDVCAVVTSPDRKAGRGMKIKHSAVKDYALQHELPILQPTNLKSEDFQAELRRYNPNIQVVIAFRMLPEKVWNCPPLGTINLHASLLPDYRGAAPINWAIINGESVTGVSTFRLKHEIDTGNLLKQKEVSISEDDNAGSLHDKLMNVGADLMVETLREVENGSSQEYPQVLKDIQKHAPKIFKQDCMIDWQKPAKQVRDLVRGLSPYPVARTKIDNKILKVFSCEVIENLKLRAGQIDSDNETYIHVGTDTDAISLDLIQLEGKKRMKVDEFLRGFNIAPFASLV